MNADQLFTFPDSLPFQSFFPGDVPPWEWVSSIAPALKSFDFAAAAADNHPALIDGAAPRQGQRGLDVQGNVFIHPTAKLPAYATIIGPVWIGPECEIRPGAYLRGNVIVGSRCVIGHNGEYKNSLLLDDVQTPHRPYVGDSVLGNRAHLGAGVVLANLRLDQGDVPVMAPGKGRTSSGRRKLGAMMGDGAEVGCNSVLQPGTILGRGAIVMGSMAFSGTLEENHMAWERSRPSIVPRRD